MFRVADLVMLLSGGPVMTILATTAMQVQVAWIGSDGAPHDRWYPPSCLKPAVVPA